MRILLTNDDGVLAPGLAALEEIARTLSDDIWVVAPHEERSGAGHSLTLNHPLRYRQLAERRFDVSGTPSDCVIMAVTKIMPEKPDLILSGVNRGQNLAEDMTYSGTIAAAMEGTEYGIRSIAMSQVIGMHDNGKTFAVARKHGPALIKKLASFDAGAGHFLNVNFPDCRADEVAGVEVTRQGKREMNTLFVDERVDARGNPYFWLGFRRDKGSPPEGTDLAAAYAKRISVTPLHLNLTQHTLLDRLKSAL